MHRYLSLGLCAFFFFFFWLVSLAMGLGRYLIILPGQGIEKEEKKGMDCGKSKSVWQKGLWLWLLGNLIQGVDHPLSLFPLARREYVIRVKAGQKENIGQANRRGPPLWDLLGNQLWDFCFMFFSIFQFRRVNIISTQLHQHSLGVARAS